MMSWDPIWEEIFRARSWGRYPPEELVRFVATRFGSVSDRSQVRILEIGCGEGANIWFLARERFDVHGVDGSKTAIAKAERRLQEEGLGAHLQVGDVIRLGDLYPALRFDAVIDVACLMCNRVQAMESILDQVRAVLKPGGRVFSMTIASGSWGDGLGREIEPGTFVDITEGPLHGRGLCHLLTGEEASGLFGSRFGDLRIEYSIRSLSRQKNLLKHWVIEGVKDK